MKYIPLGIIIVLFITIFFSVTISDKYAVIGHNSSLEEVIEIRHDVFSGRKHGTIAHSH